MANAANEFLTQWTEPSDIFSILLILGGDVIRLALATLSGGLLTPAAFSFGWVAYAISALLSAIGENRLMQCPPEVAMLAINLKSGYGRANQSWLLARLMKTYTYWMPVEVRETLRNPRVFKDEEGGGFSKGGKAQQGQQGQQARSVALCVAVYRWSEGREAGFPTHDWVWWSGFATTAIQLGVSAIPFGRHGDWSIFLVTACGTLLAYASGSLPQWRKEKWHARKQNGKKDVGLTLGNGSKHVVVILGADGTLDLEDLAGGWTVDLISTRVCTFSLAILWLVLLVTSTGIKTNTWYLLAVGGLGMLQNLMVAGAPRSPESLGLPIELVKMTATEAGAGAQQREVPAIFAEEKVMWTLMEFEEKFENHGRSLLAEFFPGKLRPWEEQWWAEADPAARKKLLSEAQKKHYAEVK